MCTASSLFVDITAAYTFAVLIIGWRMLSSIDSRACWAYAFHAVHLLCTILQIYEAASCQLNWWNSRLWFVSVWIYGYEMVVPIEYTPVLPTVNLRDPLRSQIRKPTFKDIEWPVQQLIVRLLPTLWTVVLGVKFAGAANWFPTAAWTWDLFTLAVLILLQVRILRKPVV